MKYRVITIEDNPQSVKSAQRCIDSAKQFGIEVENAWAFTPRHNPYQHFGLKKLPIENFEKDAQKYSRLDNVLSAFLSHFNCWRYAAAMNEETCILEHDAYFFDGVPDNLQYKGILTIGKPSYGKFNTPSTLGVGPLVHKRYFGGAHAYCIKPEAANELLLKAETHAGPTDVFLNLDNFPDLEEYYPWPVEARDTFTTIQRTEGCLAKHQYNDNYEII
jgi:GR25 family glycosyltransferase involved in LPS biosynthesis